MFAGLISKEQGVSAWGDPVQIISALAPYSLDKPRDVWATDRQLLLQVATRTGSSTAEIYRHPESGVGVAFWGRLDNRPDLIAQLDVEHKAADDELIALAWLKWGEFCPEKLIGDFAFAVASPKTGVVFLARDVMGVKPLYYRADQHGIFFANSAAAFKPLKLGTLTRSQEWMARYMLDISQSHTDTAYEEIKKLASAHSLLIHSDGRMNIRRYHQFVDDAPIEKKRDPKYLEAYRATWQEAVACRMPASGNIGTETSGGLDSASVTAELARQLGSGKDRLFGFGSCNQLMEPEAIMATAMKYEMRYQLMFSDNDVNYYKTMQSREIAISGYPHQQEIAAANYPFYDECKLHNIGTLYSGFGGDEVVTLEFPTTIELSQLGDFQNLYKVMPGNWHQKLRSSLKMLLKKVRFAELVDSELSVYKERWQYYFLNDAIIKKYALYETYLQQAKFLCPTWRINDFALTLINQPYHSTRLDNCTLMASSYGIDYVWPMWDQRLVQQWLSTPIIWKMGNNALARFLHRKAIDGVCPNSITWKPSKDMGFAHAQAKIANTNLKPYLQQIAELIAILPSDLQPIFNPTYAKHLLQKCIDDDLQSFEAYLSISYTLEYLFDLSQWLKSR